MRAEEIFELVLHTTQGCKNADHENRYVLITKIASIGYKKTFWSYTELYNILTKYIEKYSRFEEFDSEDIQLTPPDQKYPHKKHEACDCITHAALCLQLGPCLLSDYSDSLLMALHKLNSIGRMVFENVLPDMTVRSIYYNSNMPAFYTEPTYCYWYAKCAFIDYDKTIYYNKLKEIGLEQTIKLGQKVTSKIEWDTLPEYISLPVFICLASGNCNLFSLFELYTKEFSKANKTYVKYKSLLIETFKLNYYTKFYNLDKPFFDSKTPIYIYINQNGEVKYYPNESTFEFNFFVELINDLAIRYNSVSRLFTNFYENISKGINSTNCLNSRDNSAYLQMNNKIINDTTRDEIKTNIQKGGIYALYGCDASLLNSNSNWVLSFYGSSDNEAFNGFEHLFSEYNFDFCDKIKLNKNTNDEQKTEGIENKHISGTTDADIISTKSNLRVTDTELKHGIIKADPTITIAENELKITRKEKQWITPTDADTAITENKNTTDSKSLSSSNTIMIIILVFCSLILFALIGFILFKKSCSILGSCSRFTNTSHRGRFSDATTRPLNN